MPARFPTDLRGPLTPLLAAALAAVCGCGAAAGSAVPQTRTTSPAAAARAATTAETTSTAPVRVAPSRQPVPILMYHVIGTPRPGASGGRMPMAGLWVTPEDFRAHVKALADAGYEAVTLTTALDAWRGRATLPAKPVVFSFDDGYLSQGQEAAPALKAQGWPGVLYLTTRNLGVEGGLSATRIRMMLRDGWELGSHTLTHPDLTTLGGAALKREVASSRALLRKRFGVPVSTFCYPSGRYDARVESAVRAAGYRAATTVVSGAARPSGDRLALPRVRVMRGESAAALLAAVRAAGG